MSTTTEPEHHDHHDHHRTREALKRFSSRLFGKHRRSQSDTNASHASSSTNTNNSSGPPSVRPRPVRSLSSRALPSRRVSLQGSQNLMSAALPAAGPDRVRATLALLAELEKYDHLQRRSMLRNLPPLKFRIIIERRVNGHVQETEAEVSMDELREQLREVLRAEGNGVPSTSTSSRAPRVDGNLREVKATGKHAVKDVTIFPTHICDGNFHDDALSTCTICLEEFLKGEEIKMIPCLHFYHSECIDEWFKRSDCCPICNFHVDDNCFKGCEGNSS